MLLIHGVLSTLICPPQVLVRLHSRLAGAAPHKLCPHRVHSHSTFLQSVRSACVTSHMAETFFSKTVSSPLKLRRHSSTLHRTCFSDTFVAQFRQNVCPRRLNCPLSALPVHGKCNIHTVLKLARTTRSLPQPTTHQTTPQQTTPQTTPQTTHNQPHKQPHNPLMLELYTNDVPTCTIMRSISAHVVCGFELL